MKITYQTAKNQLYGVQEEIHTVDKMKWSQAKESELIRVYAKLAEILNDCYESNLTTKEDDTYLDWLADETLKRLDEVFYKSFSYEQADKIGGARDEYKRTRQVPYFMFWDTENWYFYGGYHLRTRNRVSVKEAGEMLCSLAL